MVASEPVFKVLTNAEWSAFKESGLFAGNAADIKDGYIHLAKKTQLERVVQKHYKGVKALWLIEFAGPEFLSGLSWEPASNGDHYPHLYGDVLKYPDVGSVEAVS